MNDSIFNSQAKVATQSDLYNSMNGIPTTQAASQVIGAGPVRASTSMGLRH